MMWFYIQIMNLPKLWLNADLGEKKGACFKNHYLNINHAVLSHQSAAACGQTSSPSPPSPSPPDPLPKVNSQSVRHPGPALWPSTQGHLQWSHGHLAGRGQHQHRYRHWHGLWPATVWRWVLHTCPPPSGNKMVSWSVTLKPFRVSIFPLTSCLSSAGQQDTTDVTNWKEHIRSDLPGSHSYTI